MKFKSYGKINLSLEVLNKREDGYHNIDTIMQFVDIYDELDIEKTFGKELEIQCDLVDFPKGEDNLIYKAWEKLKGLYSGNPGIAVKVKKNLPIAAGMGGGSSNCASMMEGLNRLWKLGLSKEQLQRLGGEIGSDIPFFFEEDTLRARGRGFDFEKMTSLQGLPIVIVNSGCRISTPFVYSKVAFAKNRKMDILLESLESGEIDKDLFFNSMTEVSSTVCPEIKKIIEKLYSLNSKVALMSGSGATVFGIFDDEKMSKKAFEILKDRYKYVYNTRTIRRSNEG
ncbi:4-(cytidine 5'-diphospho)-2-C-methyl-D-erythritol kinase [Lagierella sp.]|uniref:4-(cytidine 5'-diphospho)-2-C-methyl-D-erythritol kinase n=1 Tax=Lagierella sp. TaxID=2849657 RepID=UPI00262DD14E|nr:4-(cytidine 5'-diphospho)-2-C-methyl-D-erythritol kinase [Lagierella sp.]